MIVANVKQANFWYDNWCEDKPIREQFPELFEIHNENSCTVLQMADSGWHSTFQEMAAWRHEIAIRERN